MKIVMRRISEGMQIIRGIEYKGDRFFVGDVFQQGDEFYELCEGDVCFYLKQLTTKKVKIVKAIVDDRFLNTSELTTEQFCFSGFKHIGNMIDDLELLERNGIRVR